MAREHGTPPPIEQQDLQKRRKELETYLSETLRDKIMAVSKNLNHPVFATLSPGDAGNWLGMDITKMATWNAVIDDEEERKRVFELLAEYKSIPDTRDLRPPLPPHRAVKRDVSQRPPNDDPGSYAQFIEVSGLEQARMAVHMAPTQDNRVTRPSVAPRELAPAVVRQSIFKRLQGLLARKK